MLKNLNSADSFSSLRTFLYIQGRVFKFFDKNYTHKLFNFWKFLKLQTETYPPSSILNTFSIRNVLVKAKTLYFEMIYLSNTENCSAKLWCLLTKSLRVLQKSSKILCLDLSNFFQIQLFEKNENIYKSLLSEWNSDVYSWF